MRLKRRVTRIFWVALMFFVFQQAEAFDGNDTIPNWQIYYGEKLIVAGHEPNVRVPDVGIIHVKNSADRLKIVYRYDSVKPRWRAIEIKNGPEILYSAEDRLRDNQPHEVDVGELIMGKTSSFYIQIYYSDHITPEKDRLIGEIEIRSQ